jgi:hypothetical protein
LFFFAIPQLCCDALVKDAVSKLVTGKEKEETGSKRGRSNSTTLPQRVPLGPGRGVAAPPVSNTVAARAPPIRTRISSVVDAKRTSRTSESDHLPIPEEIEAKEAEVQMDIEDDLAEDRNLEDDADLLVNEREVEAMIGIDDDEDEDAGEAPANPKSQRARIWPEVSTDRARKFHAEVEAVREVFQDQIDVFDTTMVSEYAEEIYEYMCDLEVCQSFLCPSSSLILENLGGDDAQSELHGWSKRNYVGDAPDAG